MRKLRVTEETSQAFIQYLYMAAVLFKTWYVYIGVILAGVYIETPQRKKESSFADKFIVYWQNSYWREQYSASE
jgi:hypothetical protein